MSFSALRVHSSERRDIRDRRILCVPMGPDWSWVTSIARGKTAFYDIDTPITLARLEAGEADSLRLI